VTELIALGMVTLVKMIESEMATAQLTPLQHAIFQLYHYIYDEATAVKALFKNGGGSESFNVGY
jgi:hypothetical protein